jgi:hypothetical protein
VVEIAGLTPRIAAVEIPIACTLEPSDARAQGDEWREMLGRLVGGAERVAPGVLRLWLRADLDELPQLVALAQREKACCGFFSFSFEVEVDGLALVVGVPPGAVAILDDFATLSPSQ